MATRRKDDVSVACAPLDDAQSCRVLCSSAAVLLESAEPRGLVSLSRPEDFRRWSFGDPSIIMRGRGWRRSPIGHPIDLTMICVYRLLAACRQWDWPPGSTLQGRLGRFMSSLSADAVVKARDQERTFFDLAHLLDSCLAVCCLLQRDQPNISW